MEEVKKVKESGSKEEIENAVENLNQASYKMAEAMYKQQPAAEQAPGGPGPGAEAGAADEGAEAEAPQEDVVDADYEVVDDDESKTD